MQLREIFPLVAGSALLVTSALVTSACEAPDEGGSAASDDGGEPSASVATLSEDADIAAMLPAPIRESGTVEVASGVSFPPMEFFDTDNETVIGFDADLGAALGQVLGVEFEFHNTNFDGIIGGLNAGRYDLAITSMIDNKERQASVDFVDYLESGVSFLVTAGNPAGLTDKLDLCGTPVAVEKASLGDLTADDISKECTDAGDDAVDKQPFPDQASAVQALQSGRVDAVLALDLTLAYNMKENPDAFEVPSAPFGALPVGIAIPKASTELRDAVQAALKKVIESGTYDELLAKWNLTDQALTGAPINQGR
jgi:polar amino acid transport system substrate-binding protein